MDVILWVNDVIGKPWVDRADGPDAYDCWGIVVDSFRRVDGIEITPVTGYEAGEPIDTAGATEIQSGRWQKLDKAKSGAVACYYDAQGSLAHVGRVYLLTGAGLNVIHAKGSTQRIGRVAADSVAALERLYRSGSVEYWELISG